MLGLHLFRSDRRPVDHLRVMETVSPLMDRSGEQEEEAVGILHLVLRLNPGRARSRRPIMESLVITAPPRFALISPATAPFTSGVY